LKLRRRGHITDFDLLERYACDGSLQEAGSIAAGNGNQAVNKVIRRIVAIFTLFGHCLFDHRVESGEFLWQVGNGRIDMHGANGDRVISREGNLPCQQPEQ